MIVIGSYAAKLGGFFPEWRAGECSDIDLVCRRSEFDALVSLIAPPRHLGGDHYRWWTGGLSIDATIHNDDLVTLMEGLSGDPVEVELHREYLPMLCHVAPVEVVWSTLYLTAGCAPVWADKSWRDLAHYDALVESRGLITDDHWTVAKAYRRMMVDWITAQFE